MRQFWRNGIDPKKIVLGLGFYGRSFELDDANCWAPGCQFSGPGLKGPCTDSPGILSFKGKTQPVKICLQISNYNTEIDDIIKTTGATPLYDTVAKVNYMVYNENNWIS